LLDSLLQEREVFKVGKYHRVMEVEVADSLASRRRVEANTGFRFPHVSSGSDTSWAVATL